MILEKSPLLEDFIREGDLILLIESYLQPSKEGK